MNNNFTNKIISIDKSIAQRIKLSIIQVNVGDLCNKNCMHCHIGASPAGNRVMKTDVMDSILEVLSQDRSLTLDITGGCPEMNPNFKYLVSNARKKGNPVMVRTNLTIILEKGMESLPQFYREHKIKLIGSMPCYTKENVDAQRGKGTFDESIKALTILNEIGYGVSDGLQLDLVYNPGGAFLPGGQKELELDYKRILNDNYGIKFNHLSTITNAPIKRFKNFLETNNSLNEYMQLLKNSFNQSVADKIMCRELVNVGFDGLLYDCDFNQAMNLPLRNKDGAPISIDSVSPEALYGNSITFDEHCFSCTAGQGSSCTGSLEAKKAK